MPGNFFDKFPAEILEYDFDASDILINGDAIQLVNVVALSGGISILSSGFSGSIVSFRVGGGNPGALGIAVANVTLVSGQFRQAPVMIVIKPLPA